MRFYATARHGFLAGIRQGDAKNPAPGERRGNRLSLRSKAEVKSLFIAS